MKVDSRNGDIGITLLLVPYSSISGVISSGRACVDGAMEPKAVVVVVVVDLRIRRLLAEAVLTHHHQTRRQSSIFLCVLQFRLLLRTKFFLQ